MKRKAGLGRILKISMLASAYAALTLTPPFNSFGYGPVQARVAEALTVLPYIGRWSMWGLYLGCVLANLGSPFLAWDLTIGALSTLLAAWWTSRVGRAQFAPMPPVVINALFVSAYVSKLSGTPYWLTALYVAAGQALACYGLGYPLLLYIMRNKKLLEFLRDERTD